MNTPAIVNPAIVSANTAPAARQTDAPISDTPFHQVLSREMTNRGNVDGTQDSATNGASGTNAADLATAKAVKKSEDKEIDSADEDTSDTGVAASMADAPAGMLALMATIGSLVPTEAGQPGTAANAAAATDERPLPVNTARSPSRSRAAAPDPQGGSALATDAKTAIEDRLPAIDAGTVPEHSSLAADPKTPTRQPLPAADTQPDARTAQMASDLRSPLPGPVAPESNAHFLSSRTDVSHDNDSGISNLPKDVGMQGVQAHRQQNDSATAMQSIGTQKTLAGSNQPDQSQKLDATPSYKAALATDPNPERITEKQASDAAAIGATVLPAITNGVQALAAHAAERLTPRVGSPAWEQALGQKVVWMIAGDQQSASLTLNPPDLGPLQVVLSVSNAHADAAFFAAQPEARQAIEAAMPKLREMLGEAGIQLGQATVGAGTPGQGGEAGRQFNGASRATMRMDDANDAALQIPVGRTTSGAQGLVDTFV